LRNEELTFVLIRLTCVAFRLLKLPRPFDREIDCEGVAPDPAFRSLDIPGKLFTFCGVARPASDARGELPPPRPFVEPLDSASGRSVVRPSEFRRPSGLDRPVLELLLLLRTNGLAVGVD